MDKVAELIDKSPYATTDNLQAARTLTENTIANLDAEAIAQLSGGTELGFQDMVEDIFVESFHVLTDRGKGKIQTSDFQYLDKLANSFHETLMCESLNYFIQEVDPEFEIDWIHMEWENHLKNYRNLAVQAARGRSKSAYFSVRFPLWLAYRYSREVDTPKKYKVLGKEICLFSAGKSLPRHFLGEIKDIVEHNDLLRDKLYSNKKWGNDGVKFKNGSEVYVKSYDAYSRGYHPTAMVIDDLLTDNELYSADQREKKIEFFFSTLRKMVIKGQTVFVGTPFHIDDLFGEIEENSKWQMFKYPAIFPDGTISLEAMYDYDYIMSELDELGSLRFSREILCIPVQGDSSLFTDQMLANARKGGADWTLKSNRWELDMPARFKKIVGAVDLARSATTAADFFVFVTFGIDYDNNMWLLNVVRERGLSFTNQIATVSTRYENFKHDVIYVEANQYQEVFAQQLEETTSAPVEPYTTGSEKHSLISGVPSLTILFEKNKIHFPTGDGYSESITNIILGEFRSIAFTDNGVQGVGSHDDTVMAIWLAYLASKEQDLEFGLI